MATWIKPDMISRLAAMPAAEFKKWLEDNPPKVNESYLRLKQRVAKTMKDAEAYMSSAPGRCNAHTIKERKDA